MERQAQTGEALQAAAIILARGGSKGVPGKNLAQVGGRSLLARSIAAARGARGVGVVLVSTDCAAIAAEARRHGAQVVARPASLAGDGAGSEPAWRHAALSLPARPARLVFLQCTSPFTTAAEIEACLAALAGGAAGSAHAVIADHGFYWARDAQGHGVGLGPAAAAPRPRRQDMAPRFRESGAIYAVDTARFLAEGHRFCPPVALVPVAHPILEIDTPADLAHARALAAHRGWGPGPAELGPLRALITDFDGVHTDDRVSVDETGRESVRASRADGLGLARLRALGRHRLLIVSAERNPVVRARAAKLGIEALTGIDDKQAAISAWLAAAGLGWEAVLYVGNDRNDAAAMARAGLSACPADAAPEILAQAGWVLPRPGGQGALRVVADALCAAAAAPLALAQPRVACA